MPMSCIKGCPSSRRKDGKAIRYFRMPTKRKGFRKTYKLTVERIRLWKIAINKEHLNFNSARICSRHFISEDKSSCENRDIKCCVPDCKNVRGKGKSKVKFFRFPNASENNGKIKRTERLAAWIKAINRVDITASNAAYKIICS